MPSLRSLLIPDNEDPLKKDAVMPPASGPMGGQPAPTGVPMPAPVGAPQQPPAGVQVKRKVTAPPTGAPVSPKPAAPSSTDTVRQKLAEILSPVGTKEADRVNPDNAALAQDIERRGMESLPGSGSADINTPVTSNPQQEKMDALGKGYPELQYKPSSVINDPTLVDNKRSKKLASNFKMLLQTGRTAASVLKDLPDLPGGLQSSKLAKDALAGPQPRTEGGMLAEGADPLAGVTQQVNQQDIFSDAVRRARAIVGDPKAKQGQKDSAVQSIIGMSAYLNGDIDDVGVFTSAHQQLDAAGIPTSRPDNSGVLASALKDIPIYKKFFSNASEKAVLTETELTSTFNSAARVIAGKWLSGEITKLTDLATKGVYTGEGPESGKGIRVGAQKQAVLVKRLLGGFKRESDVGDKIQIASDNPFNTYVTRRITAAFRGSKGIDKDNAKRLAGMAGASDTAAKQIADMFGINKELANLTTFDYRGREKEFADASDRANIYLDNGEDDKAAKELAPFMNKVQKRVFFPGVDIEVYGSTPNQFGIDTAENVAARGVGDTSSRRTAVETNISNMQTALTKDKKRELTYAPDPENILLGVGRGFGIDTTTTVFGKRDLDRDLALKNFDPDVAMEDLDQLLRVTVDENGVAYGDKLHDNTMNSMRGLISKIDDRLKTTGKEDPEYKSLNEFKTFLTEKLDDTSEMLDRSNSSGAGRSSSPFFERAGATDQADFTRPKQVTGKQRLAQGFDIIDAWVNKKGINAPNYFGGVDLASSQVGRSTVSAATQTSVKINPVSSYGEFIKEAPAVDVIIDKNGNAVVPVYQKRKTVGNLDVQFEQATDPKTGKPMTMTVTIPQNQREQYGVGTRTSSLLAAGLSGDRYGIPGGYIAQQARQMHSLIVSSLAEGAPDYAGRRKYIANLMGPTTDPDSIAGMSDVQFSSFLGRMNRDQGKRLLAFAEAVDAQGTITGDMRASSSYNATSTRGKSRGIDDRVVAKISRNDIATKASEDVADATRSLLRVSQTIDRNADPNASPEDNAKRVQDIITSEASKIPEHIRPEFIDSANRLTRDIQSGDYSGTGIDEIKNRYADTLRGSSLTFWESNSDAVPTKVVSDGRILISPGKGRGDDIRIAAQRSGESVSKTIESLVDPDNADRAAAFVDSLDAVSKDRVKLALKQLKTTIVDSDQDIQLKAVLRDELNGMIKRGIKIDPATMTVDIPDYLKPSRTQMSEAQLADEAREAVSGIKKLPTLGELDPKAQYVLDQKQAYFKLQRVITTGWAIAQTTGNPEDYQKFLRAQAKDIPMDVLNKVIALNKDMVKSLGGDDKAWNSLGIGYDTETKTVTGLNDPRFLTAFERQWKKLEPSVAANMPAIKRENKRTVIDMEASGLKTLQEAKDLEAIYERNKRTPEQKRTDQRRAASREKSITVVNASAPAVADLDTKQSSNRRTYYFESPLLKDAMLTYTAPTTAIAKDIEAVLKQAKSVTQLEKLAEAKGVIVDRGFKAKRQAAEKAAAEKAAIKERQDRTLEGAKAGAKQTPASKAAATQRAPAKVTRTTTIPQPPPQRPQGIQSTAPIQRRPPSDMSQGTVIRTARRSRGLLSAANQAVGFGRGFAAKLGGVFGGGRNATTKPKK